MSRTETPVNVSQLLSEIVNEASQNINRYLNCLAVIGTLLRTKFISDQLPVKINFINNEIRLRQVTY